MHLAAYHAATIAPGGARMIGKQFWTAYGSVPRGHVAVDSENRRYLYKVPHDTSRRELRAAIFSAFDCARVTGKYPIYTAEDATR